MHNGRYILGGFISKLGRRSRSGRGLAISAATEGSPACNLPRLTAERAIAEATDLSIMDLDEAAF